MKLIHTLLILLTIQLTAFGQHELGFKACVGFSRLLNHAFFWESHYAKSKLAPSGYGGFYYTYHKDNKSFWGTELLFSQIAGNIEQSYVFYDNNGTIVESVKKNDYWHLSYIGLPVYYGRNLKKFKLCFGMQLSYFIGGSRRETEQRISMGNVTNKEQIWRDHFIPENFDFGARAEVIYNLTNKFAIEATYYNGVKNTKFQQITVGIRYSLIDNGQQARNEKSPVEYKRENRPFSLLRFFKIINKKNNSIQIQAKILMKNKFHKEWI